MPRFPGMICVDWLEAVRADSGREEGWSCPLGQVRSVCVAADREARVWALWGRSCCSPASLSRPAIALCTDDHAGLDERNDPLCFHLLDPFSKSHFGQSLVKASL